MKSICLCVVISFILTGFINPENSSNASVKNFSGVQGDVSEFLYDTVPVKKSYLDLSSGQTIEIWYDVAGLRTLNKKTGATVEFYVNTTTNDTVFGKGKYVVNGYMIRAGDGKWKFDDGKLKVDGDELKLKIGDQKLKIDGDEIKVKGKGAKLKAEDGEKKSVSSDSSRVDK